MEPTTAGIALLEEARSVLARAAQIDNTVRRTARGEQGRLAIGFTPSAALHPFVPEALRIFAAARPGVRLELDEAGTTELVDAMLQGRLDVAFVRSAVDNFPGLIVDPVLDEPMLAALPVGHGLASNTGEALPFAALAAEAFILYRRPAGPGLYDAIVTACRAAGFTPNVVQEVPRLPSTLSLVAAGLGISLVPASMRRIAMAGVSFRPLCDAPSLSAPLHLALRRAALSPTAARFRETVRHLATAQS